MPSVCCDLSGVFEISTAAHASSNDIRSFAGTDSLTMERHILVLMKRIAILGSTGSIGQSTLSIVESYPDRFQVATLAAGRNLDAALEQTIRWKPRLISVAVE